MPMNEITHANATAQTARGCRNGLATGPCAAVMWALPTDRGGTDPGLPNPACLYRPAAAHDGGEPAAWDAPGAERLDSRVKRPGPVDLYQRADEFNGR